MLLTSGTMIRFATASLLVASVVSIAAQERPPSKDAADAIDFLKTACASGEVVRVEAVGGADASVVKLVKPEANVTANFTFKRDDFRGIAKNLRDDAAVQDRKEIRECMKPYVDRILDVLLPPTTEPSSSSKNTSPH